MSPSPFVTLVFHGKRFNGAQMPLEVLPELAAYRELVLAIAKSLHQSRHPERQRLPKGFESGFRLVLQGVGEGSAVPMISRVTDLLFPDEDYFAQARDLVERAVEAAANDNDLPAALSKDLIARFNSFGRTLGDDEWITVGKPGVLGGATYNRQVRRRLILHAQGTYEDEVDLVGEVRATDKDGETFGLRMSDGRKLQVRTLPHFMRIATRASDKEELVRVRGTGLFDVEGTLLRVVIATDVSPAEEGVEPTRPGCPTPVDAQLDSLRALASGWYDASSPGYEPEALAWLSKLLTALLDGFALPRPYIYPTPEGLARAEWSSRTWEIITSFDLHRHAVDALAVRLDADEIRETSIPLSEPGGETKLGRFLEDYLGAQA